jgi:hypothetical protein
MSKTKPYIVLLRDKLWFFTFAQGGTPGWTKESQRAYKFPSRYAAKKLLKSLAHRNVEIVDLTSV